MSLSQLGLWPEIPDACFEAVKEKPPLSVTACEPTVNRTVIQQMRSTIFKDYFIVDNEKRLGDDNYSQYQSSREDFGIHSLYARQLIAPETDTKSSCIWLAHAGKTSRRDGRPDGSATGQLGPNESIYGREPEEAWDSQLQTLWKGKRNDRSYPVKV